MVEKTQLEIPLLLPDVPDDHDQCVDRLIDRLVNRRGIEHVHVDRADGASRLCLHFDPDQVSLAQVQRAAGEVGATITDRYRHETLRITGMDCGNCAQSIEHILERLPGIVAVSVNYAAELMRVEYDTADVSRAEIVRRIHWMGYSVAETQPGSWFRRHRELLFAGLCGLLLAVAFLGETLANLPRAVAIAVYILAYFAGGYDAARHGVKAALKWRFDIDVLMVARGARSRSAGRMGRRLAAVVPVQPRTLSGTPGHGPGPARDSPTRGPGAEDGTRRS